MQQEQTERLRHAVLQYLAERPQLAFNSKQIKNGLLSNRMLDFTVSDDDMAGAMLFLAGKGWIKMEADAMGATRYAQVSSDGTLAHERARAELEGKI